MDGDGRAECAQFTLLIKTIWRPEKCLRLLKSVRAEYPSMPIVVVDDGPTHKALSTSDVAHLQVTYRRFKLDIGIGACYNTAVREMITTPYVIICDDDNVFDKTDLSLFLPHLDDGTFDVLGGAVMRRFRGKLQKYVGTFEINNGASGREIIMWPIDINGLTKPIHAHYIMNFFAATRDAMLRCPYDENLKVCRHEDWFLMAYQRALKVGYHPGPLIVHDPEGEPRDPTEYNQLRSERFSKFRDMFYKKWGLRPKGLRTP